MLNQCNVEGPPGISDQLSRLHMILKPFMLRRIKKDVENELSDKVRKETFTMHQVMVPGVINSLMHGECL